MNQITIRTNNARNLSTKQFVSLMSELDSFISGWEYREEVELAFMIECDMDKVHEILLAYSVGYTATREFDNSTP